MLNLKPPPNLKLQYPNPLLFPSKPLSLPTLCSSKPSSSPLPSLASLILSIPNWADAIKERGVRKRRPLYTPDDWRFHRSSRRHLRHLLSSLSSRVILSLVPPVLSFTSAAAALALYNSAVSSHLLPAFLPLLRASSLPYQLTAPALALLLVFRTEASYSRFEEGRKVWMRVVAGASEMAGTVLSARGAGDERFRRAVVKYIMAFPVALKCHVINGSDINADLQNLLEEDDIAVVVSSKHRPRCIIEFILQSLQMLHLEEPKHNILLMGIPIPLSYTRLTSRFLVLWHLTLPVILWDDCNWIVVPATFVSAASLFCIEEVGVLIEEPFPMLALDELCQKLHEGIREAIALENSVHVRLAAKMKGQPDGHSLNGRPNS